MSDEFAIRIRDLTIDRDGIRLLDGASIDVEPGERLGVVGGEGASRSAFTTALLGDVDPAHRVRGSVRYRTRDGDEVDLLDASAADVRRFRWRHVALVPATPSGVFNPVTSVGTAFEETLEVHGADVGEGMDRAAELLSTFGLDAETVLAATPDEVGSGDLETAGLALALLLEPAVLVVEESEAVLRRLVRDAPAIDDVTVVAVASDPRLVGAYVTRLAVLYDGEFVEVGPTESVLDDPDHPYARELARLL